MICLLWPWTIIRLLIKGCRYLRDTVGLISPIRDLYRLLVAVGFIFVIEKILANFYYLPFLLGRLLITILVPVGAALQVLRIRLGAIQGVVDGDIFIRVAQTKLKLLIIKTRFMGKPWWLNECRSNGCSVIRFWGGFSQNHDLSQAIRATSHHLMGLRLYGRDLINQLTCCITQ